MPIQFLTKIFGSRNDRLLKTYRKTVARINGLESQFEQLSDAEKMMRREGIHWLDSSSKSIEEISTTVMQEIRLENKATAF